MYICVCVFQATYIYDQHSNSYTASTTARPSKYSFRYTNKTASSSRSANNYYDKQKTPQNSPGISNRSYSLQPYVFQTQHQINCNRAQTPSHLSKLTKIKSNVITVWIAEHFNTLFTTSKHLIKYSLQPYAFCSEMRVWINRFRSIIYQKDVLQLFCTNIHDNIYKW